MKSILTLGIIALFSVAKAQNYQTINSNQIHYFGKPDLTYIVATRTDSVELVGTDSVFYSFKTRRNVNGIPTPGCQYLLGPNWYGEKTIIKSNGDNLFFNENLDTIKISTQASLNDTFLVYVYPSTTDSIYGWVSSTDTLTILGTLDSIKTIDLFSTTTLTITNPQIIISKNHGFAEVFAFYDFPEPYQGVDYPYELYTHTDNFDLVGQENPRIGVTKPRVGEIYNFDIGDHFIYNYGYATIGSGPYDAYYQERTILGKTLYGTDSVTYQIRDTTILTVGDDALNIVYDIIHSSYYYSVTYKNLLEFNDTLLPEEFNTTTGNSWNDLKLNSCGRMNERIIQAHIYYDNTSGQPCIEAAPGPYYGVTSVYTSGIGFSYPIITYGLTGIDYSAVQYYSKINEESCGTPSFLVMEEKQKPLSAFTVYPNPARDAVNLIFTDASDNINTIFVMDIAGKIVYQENANSNQLSLGYEISLAHLGNGIYFIVLQNGERQLTQKLMKQ